jgi:hypothetical protein
MRAMVEQVYLGGEPVNKPANSSANSVAAGAETCESGKHSAVPAG